MCDIIVVETSVFVRPHVNDKLAVFKVHSGDRFLGTYVFGARTGRFRVGGRLKIPWCGLKFLQPNVTALRVWCKWIDPLWAKQQLCTNITLACTFLRRPLHDYDVKLPNPTFCGGPRTHGDELLLLDPHAVFRIKSRKIRLRVLSWTTLHERNKVKKNANSFF